ncbi:hypothetical protein N7450_011540 [Penicillium hetheringtonii]|uniref:Uncharacterized protein n=1 Tax=Penicillium hetheringtonii TaxID=911720 RepID=A0AAD6DC98_9EURO|nr:hypothetical protein N7450_011540 [Penicillium hetheringtonii]
MVLLIPAALGGTLQVIDHQGQCFVYSTHNFGCTGISEPFAPLDGISCSNLNTKKDDKGPDSPALKAMLCGSSPKEPAWIKVHRNGVLNFHNDHGDEGNCTVDASLNKGSLCTISNSLETSAPSSKSQLSPSDPSSSHVSAVAAAPTISSDSSGSSNPGADC